MHDYAEVKVTRRPGKYKNASTERGRRIIQEERWGKPYKKIRKGGSRSTGSCSLRALNKNLPEMNKQIYVNWGARS